MVGVPEVDAIWFTDPDDNTYYRVSINKIYEPFPGDPTFTVYAD